MEQVFIVFITNNYYVPRLQHIANGHLLYIKAKQLLTLGFYNERFTHKHNNGITHRIAYRYHYRLLYHNKPKMSIILRLYQTILCAFYYIIIFNYYSVKYLFDDDISNQPFLNHN